jgi:hypothetical protein
VDIAFHYFAVKTLASFAGFNEQYAQIIAKYSQFVDDYNWYFYRRLSNIPDYAKTPQLDLFVDEWYNPLNFNPATTGFSDIVDYTTLVRQRSQKFTVAPFHFIPRDSSCVKNGDLRTYPCRNDDGSYISQMLLAARKDFLAANKNDREFCLMHIGMLLHTFADTYAHQLFTGYNGAENKVSLVKVTNNITKEDETKKYATLISKWLETLTRIAPGVIPSIGHMIIAHVPDLTHLSFSMQYQVPGKKPSVDTYSRSNTQVFAEEAGREILNYLRGCRNQGAVNQTEWAVISSKLTNAFLIDISKLSTESKIVPALSKHWQDIFPNYRYAYSSQEIKQEFITKQKATETFYRYNVFADRLLIELYGDHPRKN